MIKMEIHLTIGEEPTMALSMEEARALYNQLHEIFGRNPFVIGNDDSGIRGKGCPKPADPYRTTGIGDPFTPVTAMFSETGNSPKI